VSNLKPKELKKLANKQYDAKLDDPKAWLFTAWTLKRAAQEIGTFSRPGWSNSIPGGPEGELAFVGHVYRFLIAQSFENLLKGLLVSQGHSAGMDGKLAKSFQTHKLETLAGRLEKTRFDMSLEELETLRTLQPYLTWAGRYPIPIHSALYEIALGYSDTENRRERKLWERMAAALKTNAPTQPDAVRETEPN